MAYVISGDGQPPQRKAATAPRKAARRVAVELPRNISLEISASDLAKIAGAASAGAVTKAAAPARPAKPARAGKGGRRPPDEVKERMSKKKQSARCPAHGRKMSGKRGCKECARVRGLAAGAVKAAGTSYETAIGMRRKVLMTKRSQDYRPDAREALYYEAHPEFEPPWGKS